MFVLSKHAKTYIKIQHRHGQQIDTKTTRQT